MADITVSVGKLSRRNRIGRRVNDEMGRKISRETVKFLIRSGRTARGARVLVLEFYGKDKEKAQHLRETRCKIVIIKDATPSFFSLF